jgi:hypothetical protein
VTIENDLVDGCNSPIRAAVLYEGDSGSGIVRNVDVDVIHYINGEFPAYCFMALVQLLTMRTPVKPEQ